MRIGTYNFEYIKTRTGASTGIGSIIGTRARPRRSHTRGANVTRLARWKQSQWRTSADASNTTGTSLGLALERRFMIELVLVFLKTLAQVLVPVLEL